jgi:hypothetical protein
MSARSAIAPLVAALLLTAAAANAELVRTTDDDYKMLIDSRLADVRKALRLDDAEFSLARSIAASWTLVGPCNSTTAQIPPTVDIGFVASTIALAKPWDKLDAAIPRPDRKKVGNGK